MTIGKKEITRSGLIAIINPVIKHINPIKKGEEPVICLKKNM